MDRPNQGGSPPVPARADDAQLPLRDQVYLSLRDAVLNGEVPAAERLTEPKLSRRFGISRTPVRDALTRLVADGLLRREEYGHSVVVPSRSTVRDLHEVRAAVELRGVARCLESQGVRHDAAALGAELERWYRLRAGPPLDASAFVLEDERFHTALLAASGNAELVAVLVDVHTRIRRVRIPGLLVPGRIAAAIAEHIEIAERVLDGRLHTAHRLLHEHLAGSTVSVDLADAPGRHLGD